MMEGTYRFSFTPPLQNRQENAQFYCRNYNSPRPKTENRTSHKQSSTKKNSPSSPANKSFEEMAASITAENLMTIMDDYYDSIQLKIRGHSVFLINIKGENQSQVLEDIDELSVLLEELFDPKYELLGGSSGARIRGEIIKRLNWKLKSVAEELSCSYNEFHSVIKIRWLRDNLTIANRFKKVEPYCQIYWFTDTANKIREHINETILSLLKEGQKAIVDKQYSNFNEILTQLENIRMDYSEQLKRQLQGSIFKLCIDIHEKLRSLTISNQFSIKGLKSVINGLVKMKQANGYPFYRCFEEKIVNLEKAISKCMLKHITEIKSLFENHNFDRAEEEIISITSAKHILDEYCQEDLIEEIKKVESVKNRELKKMEDFYRKIKLPDFDFEQIEEDFGMLKSVKHVGKKYRESLTAIKELIMTKFDQELALAKQAALTDPTPYLRNYELALNSIPAELKTNLELKLNWCREDLAKIRRG